MNSLFGVGFMAGAALLPRIPRRMFCARGLAGTITLVGLGTVLYVGSADLRIIAVGALFWSATIGLMEPLLRTLIHRDCPRAILGRVMGATEVHRRVGELLPLAVAPALATRFGVQPVMIGGGALAAIIAALSLREASAVDRIVGRVGVEPADLQGLRTSDEPVSPNP
jgi:hypothetical protein